MTDLDDEMVPAVTAMLTEFGVSATYRQIDHQGFDPATGEPELGDTTDYTVLVSPMAPASVDLDGRGLAEAHRSVTYLAAEDLEFEPSLGDRLTVGTRKYRVVGIRRYESGASTAAWGLEVEGGSA